MRPATPALQALLAAWGPGAAYEMADLYSFTLAGGETIRLSSFQCGLLAPAPDAAGTLYEFPVGPPIERTRITEKIGAEVGHIDISLYAGPNDLLGLGGNLTWQHALWAGLFDGAWCRVWRAYMTPRYAVVGTISRFFGRIGEIEIGRTKTVIHVNNLLDLLTVQMPRRLFQASCTHVFGGPMCGYDRYGGRNALLAATGIGAVDIAAAGGSTQNTIMSSFTPSPTTAYDNGSITGLTGLNAGYTRTIGTLQNGGVYFLLPWIFPVVVGSDTFQLLPGCDHTLATCGGTFNNGLRYGGFPDIPPPESAI